jgi:O-antigen ligase
MVYRTHVRSLLGLVLASGLLVGGTATALGNFYQRGVFLRGWADPTQNPDLPRRRPLAGVNVELRQYDPAVLDRELGRIAAAGFTWVRQTFSWADIEPTEQAFDFSRYDLLVRAVNAHPPLQFVAVLDETPAWARRPDASDRVAGPPATMAAFGKFAGQVASHYGDQIKYYQVWDEPNLNTHWGGLDPRPADYAAMLKAAYIAIDKRATVIAAALAPTVETGPRNISDVLYLRALYDLGAADSFDAAAGKPYGFNTGPDDRVVSQDVLNFSHIILLREEMVRRGDGHKALWGSNFGWNHLANGWPGTPSIWGQVNVETQRRYTRDAYRRSEREWPWMGGLILQHWSPDAAADDPIQGFAVAPVAADWFDSGAFFAHNAALATGLYDPTDPRIEYRGDWRFGPLGADVRHQGADDPPADGSAHQLTFKFDGTALAFLIRRADYVAYMYVQVDGKPANSLPRVAINNQDDAYILLKSADLKEHTDLIPATKDLAPDRHTAQARVYLGYDRWALAGIAVGSPPDTRRFDTLILAAATAALLGLIVAVVAVRRLPVRVSGGDVRAVTAYLRRMGDVLAGLGISVLAMIGVFLTWGDTLPNVFRRDPPTLALTVLTVGLIYFSPALLVTAAALLALWIIIYNRPVVGLALVVFWSPFFLWPVQLYLSALPMVELCLLLTLSAVIVRGVVHFARWRPRRIALRSLVTLRGMDLAMLAFVVVATISLLWSDQRVPALREWRVMVVEPALFYVLLRTVRLSNRDAVRLVDVLLMAGATVAVIGLFLYVRGGQGVVVAEQGSRRLSSVYGSPNNAALFLGRCIPFAFAMLLVAPGTLRRSVMAALLGVMLIAVVLTQSGGALLLGIPVAAIIVLLLWNRRRGAVAAGIAVTGLVALIPLSRFIPRLQGVLDLTRSSSLVRTQVWTSTINLLRERPLTGAGLDQFLYLYRSRYILPDAWREPDLSHPHNVVLDYWVSLGILGLVVLIALQVTFWRSALAAWRRSRSVDPLLAAVAIGAMGSMANFLAHGIVDNSYFVIDLAYVFCLTLALVARLEKPFPEVNR